MSEVSKCINIDDNNVKEESSSIFKACNSSNLPVKPTFASRLKSVLFYEVNVELTPYQQKVEDEINEFLHQEITWEKVKNFLFQEVTFGSKKTNV